ncbi:universal stress protein [Cognataquiflexum rubidum]|uniref:universal stress protein n=1 Tax=Cognataquiflexum rubidum TaxID=2922273 RepID=UPI001F145892|nr:universal stress protein [Cognataquiflexum rubidum]MCH6234061.1 universal stress protein [Cognataquiflexum rubidum]
MENFEKAMVGMDLTEMDDILISKMGVLSEILGIKKLYFIHVSKNLALPDEIREKFPDLVAPADEAIEAEIMTIIKQNQFPENVEIEVFAEEGNPMTTFLRWAKLKDVDLIIMGRKITLKGSGSLAKTMAQKAPCSVLFLPERIEMKVPKRILLPMDFSEHTNMTINFAQKAAEQFDAEIFALHLYEVPTGYHKTGKSFEEFAKIMEENARKDFDKFVKKHQHPEFDCLFILSNKGEPGQLIIEKAKEKGMDLILMGSRGRTASAAALLGSVAEKLVEVNNEIPMLIFKKKGETMGFFDALFRI